MAIIICPDCGKEQDNLNKFCRNCGADISKVEVVVENVPQESNNDSMDGSILNNGATSSSGLIFSSSTENDGTASGVENAETIKMDGTASGVENAETIKMDGTASGVENTETIKMDGTASGVENAETIKMDGTASGVENTEIVQADTSSDSIKKCSSCGAELFPNARFCPECGKAIEETNNRISMKFCPSCGTELNPNVRFCPKCGTNLDQALVNTTSTVKTLPEKKTPIVSVLLSVLFPGLGQFYNGHSTKGLYFFAMAIISWILILFLIGLILYLLVWLWSIFDAYKSVTAINKGEMPEDKLF